jgi:hypothetical protein
VPAPYQTFPPDAGVPDGGGTTADGGVITKGIDVRLPSVGFRCCLPGMLPP